jgi:hypothetical protein
MLRHTVTYEVRTMPIGENPTGFGEKDRRSSERKGEGPGTAFYGFFPGGYGTGTVSRGRAAERNRRGTGSPSAD